jgi:hypothetical protein
MLSNPKYKKPDKDGRKPETWPPLPFEGGKRIPRYLSDAIEQWLMVKRGASRGLPIAAPLLVIVCELYKQGYWFPVRRRLAAALGTGDYSIDAALSSAMGNGEIVERYETEPGAVESRASIRRHRYIDPSKELLSVYQAAERRAPVRVRA